MKPTASDLQNTFQENPTAEQDSVADSNWQDLSSSRSLQLFRVGPLELAIFTNEILAITAWREPAPLPHAPESVLGVVSVKGKMLTVLNPAALFQSQSGPASAAPSHILALRGDEQLALAVTAIGETVAVSTSDLEDPKANSNRLILSFLRRNNSEVIVLDVKELFPSAFRGRERRRRRF